jgi:hypothetical protein
MVWRSSPEASVGRMRRGHIGKPIFRHAVCIAATSNSDGGAKFTFTLPAGIEART